MTKRIALLSDVHGNQTALEAVLENCKKQNIDEYWYLGDLMMPGPATQTLWNLLASVNTTLCLRGNWEDCFLETLRGEIDLDNPTRVYIGRLAQYAYPSVEAETIRMISQLPIYTVRHINGLKISVSHNLPYKNFGRELGSDASVDLFDDLFVVDQADIAVFGHTHQQLLRYSSKGQMIINPGSIGQPYDPWEPLKADLRANYSILEITDDGYANTEFYRITYDKTKELQRAEASNLPYQDLFREIVMEGVAHTHDKDLLRKRSEMTYLRELEAFLKKTPLIP